jgi:hypothetical protein
MSTVPKLPALLLTWMLAAPAGAQFTAPPPATDTGPKKLDACQVVARIENQVILASDLLWEANLIIQDNLTQIPPDQRDDARAMLVRRSLPGHIDTKLIYADFRRKARGADMDAIRKQLEEPFYTGGKSGNSPGSMPSLMKAFEANNLQDLERKLAEFGTSLTDRKEAYFEKAIAQTWVQEQVEVDKPTYAELAEYYDEHLDDYAFPTQARWEELTVRFDNHPSKQAAREKLAAAGNLVWPLVQQATDTAAPLFADVAKQYSDSYNAKDGGLNDWTTEGALRDDALDRALFTLPVGSLSPIIETDSACHIVRVVERRQAGHTPFAEVQDEIREKMMNDDFRKQTEALITKLRRETRIWTLYTGDTTAEAFLKSPGDGPMRR